jgi:peptidoglycan/LPS O-acetylase OafA/YrhL
VDAASKPVYPALTVLNMTSFKKPRLIIFDILRVLSIALIVLTHMIMLDLTNPVFWYIYSNIPLHFTGSPMLFGLINYNAGAIAVYIMIFVSGAVLAYQYNKITDYRAWIFKRLKRLYPAFWIAFILSSIFSTNYIMMVGLPTFLIEFLGFGAFIGQWESPLVGTFWFIGTIACLYLLFPIISSSMDRSANGTLIISIMISILSMVLISFSGYGDHSILRWFPLCNLIWYVPGIYLVRKGSFPDNTHKNILLTTLSELSFYVFLIHFTVPFIALIRVDIFIYCAAIIIGSFWLKEIDTFIQRKSDIFKLHEISYTIDDRLEGY